jgi:hypothetical protein
MNPPLQQLLPTESGAGIITFRARWQAGLETVAGHTLQKARLDLAPPVSNPLTRFNAKEQQQ